MKRVIWLLCICILLGCKKEDSQQSLNLSGAGLSHSLIGIAIQEYFEKTNIKITYNIASAGKGISLLQDNTLDFAAVISLVDKNNFEREIISIPVAIDAIAITYNIDESIQDLRLDASLISRIYTGDIKFWNDPALVALNPKLASVGKLPITPFFRAESAAASYIFSSYLSEFDSYWEEKMGYGRSLQWETGIGILGNENMAENIKRTKGSIGYGGFSQSLAIGVNIALLKNAAGNFVYPNKESITATVSEIPEEQILVINSPEENAYPLSAFLWITLYKNQNYNHRSIFKKDALTEFIRHLLSPPMQRKAEIINFFPLPETIRSKANEMTNSIIYE